MVFKKASLASLVILTVAILIRLYEDHAEKKNRLAFEIWSETNMVESKDISIKPFKIVFNETEWNDLRNRLDNSRYFTSLDASVKKFDYGFDPNYAEKLVNTWKNNYDWKNTVEELNRFEQFKATINGINIHFLRVKTNPKVEKSTPLMLVDGWPGSFYLFYKMIDHFIAQGVSYDIIVPSIPGYGYSTPLNKPIGAIKVASYFDALMRFTHGEDVEYIVHGEDWGAIVTSTLAHMYPKRVKAIHLTLMVHDIFFHSRSIISFIMSQIFPSYFLNPSELQHKMNENYEISKFVKNILDHTGYLHLQQTKPDTVAHGLTDSPVGLLAYILEKYSSWSFDQETKILGNPSGGLENFSDNELLTVVSIYWFSNSISSSMRFYKSFIDFQEYPASLLEKIKCMVPTSGVISKYEYLSLSSVVVKEKYENLREYKVSDKFGHFAAFQDPQAIGNELVQLIESL